MINRPQFCEDCPIGNVTFGYVPAKIGGGTELWVGEAAGEEEIVQQEPFVGGAGSWLNSMMRNARVARGMVSLVNTIGCHPPRNVYPTDVAWPDAVAAAWQAELARRKKAMRKGGAEQQRAYEELLKVIDTKTSTRSAGVAGVQHCAECHLWPTIESRPWSRLVALGDYALQALTGRHGITLWRGSALPLKGHTSEGVRVMPTFHPAYLMRSADMFSVAVRDLQRTVMVPPEQYNLWPSLEDVKQFTATQFAFDFEWDREGITLCGLSDRFYRALVVPFDGEFRDELQRIFENAKVLIGHNIIGADTKYFQRLGWNVTAELIDTMLIQHLVQPDYAHDLGFVASVFSRKVFWKGKGEEEEDSDGTFVPSGAQWKTWSNPDALPRELGGYGGCTSEAEAFRLYNARDVDASFQIAGPLRTTLRGFGMEKVYRLVSVPVAFICREMADVGLRIDPRRVGEIRTEIKTKIGQLEANLPEGLRPYEVQKQKRLRLPNPRWQEKVRWCKGRGASKHDPTEVTFVREGTGQCATCGATIRSGKLKQIKFEIVPEEVRVVPWNSTAKVQHYAEGLGCATKLHPKTGRPTGDKSARKLWGRQHPEFIVVDQLKKLVTQQNSFAKATLLGVDRIYFNILVHGTSEGRLSTSGRRRGIDPNIQNQPKSIRHIFVPDYPGWGILDADLVQGENMLTAWLAQDMERLERLNTPGYDEHSHMTSLFFRVPYENVLKGGIQETLRDSGKIVNHGVNYGLGLRKTQEYLLVAGFDVSENDVREMFEIWKKINSRTAAWQAEVIEMAKRQTYLCNPFGRKRWFQTRDFATKALAFLPASTLADMVLRMMIALHASRFGKELNELGVEVYCDLPEPWKLRIQVHDSLVLIGPDELHREVAQRVRAVMTQPWKELNGFALGVEMKYSTESWGKGKKLLC